MISYKTQFSDNNSENSCANNVFKYDILTSIYRMLTLCKLKTYMYMNYGQVVSICLYISQKTLHLNEWNNFDTLLSQRYLHMRFADIVCLLMLPTTNFRVGGMNSTSLWLYIFPSLSTVPFLLSLHSVSTEQTCGYHWWTSPILQGHDVPSTSLVQTVTGNLEWFCDF